jgi:hypothetical protein
MINHLVELRDTIQAIADSSNQALSLTEAQWDQAAELRNLLHKAYELQYADITPGYFYRK